MTTSGFVNQTCARPKHQPRRGNQREVKASERIGEALAGEDEITVPLTKNFFFFIDFVAV